MVSEVEWNHHNYYNVTPKQFASFLQGSHAHMDNYSKLYRPYSCQLTLRWRDTVVIVFWLWWQITQTRSSLFQTWTTRCVIPLWRGDMGMFSVRSLGVIIDDQLITPPSSLHYEDLLICFFLTSQRSDLIILKMFNFLFRLLSPHAWIIAVPC